MPLSRRLKPLTIAGLAFSALISPAAWSDVPPESNPALTPALCQKLTLELTQKMRAGNTAISETDKNILLECRKQLYQPDRTAPLPTAQQCAKLMQTVFVQGPEQMNQLQLSPEEERSLTRCPEIVQAFYIPSRAMLPTLQVNDRVMVDKTAYQSKAPQRGDIIVFTPPADAIRICSGGSTQLSSSVPFIKRVIGLPGETIELKQGKVYINQRPLTEPYIQPDMTRSQQRRVVPANSYFVLVTIGAIAVIAVIGDSSNAT